MYRKALFKLVGAAQELREAQRHLRGGSRPRSRVKVADAEPGDGEGRWVTLAGGTKVFIDTKGHVQKGPKELTGGPVPKKGEPWRGSKTSPTKSRSAKTGSGSGATSSRDPISKKLLSGPVPKTTNAGEMSESTYRNLRQAEQDFSNAKKDIEETKQIMRKAQAGSETYNRAKEKQDRAIKNREDAYQRILAAEEKAGEETGSQDPISKELTGGNLKQESGPAKGVGKATNKRQERRDAIEEWRQEGVDKPTEQQIRRRMPSTYKASEEAAMKRLGIDTLERQLSDSLDFHEVSVWGMKEVLEKAYDNGRGGRKTNPKAREKAINEIAKKVLRLETLERRWNDDDDFPEIGVWNIREAIWDAQNRGEDDR